MSAHKDRLKASLRAEARQLVNDCLLKDLDDPDSYRWDTPGWDEWQDYVEFAESVLGTCEVLTWGIK